MRKIFNFLKKQKTVRYIAFGFLSVILIGSGLLMIPGCIKEGVTVNYIDALYTSTSAVCVTGLVSIDVYDHFTLAGQIIVMLLIQIGGLGITTLGVGLILAVKRHVSLKDRSIIQESLNLDDNKMIYRIFKRVFIYTIIIEFVGACLSLITFSRDYQIGDAIFKSVFHSIAAFNNSGFDVLGGFVNLTNYSGDVLLNVVTMVLIVLGGIGFVVIFDIVRNKGNLKKMTLHTKIVLLMTFILIVGGMLLLKLSERNNITWMGALFTSISARTAGFSTFPISNFSQAGLGILIVLMFIGASPGSTGGGIKTTTFYVLLRALSSFIRHKKNTNAFKYSISMDIIKKSIVVFSLAIFLIFTGTLIVVLLEPGINFTSVLFEMTSAYATVGLSTGITIGLSVGSKIVSIALMYLGRIGPLTFMSMWYTEKEELFQYAEGTVAIG